MLIDSMCGCCMCTSPLGVSVTDVHLAAVPKPCFDLSIQARDSQQCLFSQATAQSQLIHGSASSLQ